MLSPAKVDHVTGAGKSAQVAAPPRSDRRGQPRRAHPSSSAHARLRSNRRPPASFSSAAASSVSKRSRIDLGCSVADPQSRSLVNRRETSWSICRWYIRCPLRVPALVRRGLIDVPRSGRRFRDLPPAVSTRSGRRYPYVFEHQLNDFTAGRTRHRLSRCDVANHPVVVVVVDCQPASAAPQRFRHSQVRLNPEGAWTLRR